MRPAPRLHPLTLISMTLKVAGTVSVLRIGLLVALLLLLRTAPAAVVCTGPGTHATITLPRASISVLDLPTNTIVIALGEKVGTDARLSLSITGSGVDDVLPLPTFVDIPTTQSNATATIVIRPRIAYPFTSKTITVAITNSDNVCVLIGTPSSATLTLRGFDPPRLVSTIPNATNLAVTWPSPLGYVLQSSPSLPAVNWSNVSVTVSTNNNTNLVLLPVTGRAAFFRLMKP
jgi:hypothetical protein